MFAILLADGSRQTSIFHLSNSFRKNVSRIHLTCSTPSTHLPIVRCLREDTHLLQTSATFLTRLLDHSVPCSFQTLHVARSIRQAKKFLVNYSIEQIGQIDAGKEIPSTSLFKQKKKKIYQSATPMNNTIDKEKQQVLQKLLADSRIESISTIEINPSPTDD